MTLFPSAHRPAVDLTVVPDPVPADLMAARLAARVEALEAEPVDVAPHRRVATPERGSAPGHHTSAEVDDLNQQLELLRGQLEAAFDDVDARIAAADQRAAVAEAAAAAADTRAQVASARAANVLYAVDDLAHELKRIAGSDHTDRPTVARLLGAVGRLHNRLQPPERATGPVPEVTVDSAVGPTAAAPAEPASEASEHPSAEPWDSPRSMETSTMRSSDVSDTTEVRPEVP